MAPLYEPDWRWLTTLPSNSVSTPTKVKVETFRERVKRKRDELTNKTFKIMMEKRLSNQRLRLMLSEK